MADKPYRGVVYVATNLINSKVYVGKTMRTMIARRTSHICDARNGRGQAFGAAIRKHGIDAFEWQEIMCSTDQDGLAACEMMIIAIFRKMGAILYNLTDGGEGRSGYKVSEETRAKHRRTHDEAAIARMRSVQSSPEAIARKSASSKGRTFSAETIEKMRQHAMQRRQTDATKAKLREIRKSIKMPPWTPERRAKMEKLQRRADGTYAPKQP